MSESGRLAGKVAVVTGAGRGIGREHALLLAREGARVVVNDLGGNIAGEGANRSVAERVVDEIRQADGEAVASSDSAATWDGAARIVRTAVDRFGRIDILINNATTARDNDIWRYSEDDWDVVAEVSFKGYFMMIRFAAPYMCRQRSGVIINTSSASGFGHPSMVSYAAAKEGVVGLTRTVAKELGRFNVRCNAIRPGAATDTAQRYVEERATRWMPLLNAVGLGGGAAVAGERTPGKVAQFVVWLCTDAAANVNGRTFHVAGDTIGLYSEPEVTRLLVKPGGWDLDALDSLAQPLIRDLRNAFLLEGHPELQRFEE